MDSNNWPEVDASMRDMDSDIPYWLEVTEATVREARARGHNIKCRYCDKKAGAIYKTGHEFWGMCFDCYDARHVKEGIKGDMDG